MSQFCCVLTYRSIYRLLAKHPAFWFKHKMTDTKGTVPVISLLKMFQLPVSNPTSYWACSMQTLLNSLPITIHTHTRSKLFKFEFLYHKPRVLADATGTGSVGSVQTLHFTHSASQMQQDFAFSECHKSLSATGNAWQSQ